jgi:phospholipid/cholesterol/gamma-HCH transport system substrate-binding protein
MRKYSMETGVGIFVVICLICVAYMTVKLGNVSLLGDSSYSLVARFSSVSGLRSGSDVEMLGLKIGRVAAMRMDQENQIALVELRIDKDIKVYDDAMASIKTSGLLGDRFVQIDPGGGGDLLESGGMIVDTQPAIDIMELISKYAFGDVEK